MRAGGRVREKGEGRWKRENETERHTLKGEGQCA